MGPNPSTLPLTPSSILSVPSSPTSDDDHSSSSQLLESSDYVQVLGPSLSDHPNSLLFNPSNLNVHSIDSESDRDAWFDLSSSIRLPRHHPSSSLDYDPLPGHHHRIPSTSDLGPLSLIQSPIDRLPSPEHHHHHHPDDPSLDLSCVNSDETEASLTSLFSFPDPLNSIDQVLPSDHHDSAWFARCDDEGDIPLVPSPRSDEPSNLSSDHLDSRTSPSPSLSDGDLLSHSSISSPTLPVFPEAGSDLSHTLHVYLCGHQVSQSQLREIVFNLRLNFSHLDLLKLNYSSSSHRGSSGWQWPHLTRNHFRNAVSSALLKSSPSPSSITNRDLMYETSWLEIISSDLTSLSQSLQQSLLSSLPEKPALIIYTLGSSDCFPTRWLKDLSQTCPSLIHFFKLLPVVLDEKKSMSQTLFDSLRGLRGPKTSCTVKSFSPASVTADSLSFDLFLEDTSNSMDHRCLRPRDLGLLSAPSVSRLHRLLMPFEPRQPIESTTSRASSKPFSLLACLLVIAAASLVIRPLDLNVIQTTRSFMEATKLPFFPKVDDQSHESSGAPGPLSTWNSSVAITSSGLTQPEQPISNRETTWISAPSGVDLMPSNLQAVRENSHAAPFALVLDRDDEITFSSHHQETLSGVGSIEPEIGSVPGVNNSKHSPLTRTPKLRSRKSKRATNKESEGSRDSRGMTRNVSNMIYYLNLKDRPIMDLFIGPHLSNRTVTKTILKDWTRRLPKRLRKGLVNIQARPDLCLQKLCKNSLPQSIRPACTP